MLRPDAFCEHRAYNAAKCDCGQVSAPTDAGGAYSARSDPLAGFKGAASRRGEEGSGKEGKRREREERGKKGGEWEERLTVMRSVLEQGHRLA